jgi:hypothetical protein
VLSVVSSENLDVAQQERQLVINKIIAAGVNSLTSSILSSNSNPNDPNRQLLDNFISQSFDKVMAVWPMLDERIKFHIFKANISEFEKYMKEKSQELS